MRLIDADEFEKRLNNEKWMDNFDHVFSVGVALDEAPTVDAVPVVRCGECKYYQDNNGGYPHGECRWGHDETPDADDYCSYGAKMDGERRNDDA